MMLVSVAATVWIVRRDIVGLVAWWVVSGLLFGVGVSMIGDF